MVSYGFKSQFVSKIERGTKTFTLRDRRVNGHAKKGDQLHLWQDMRQPSQRLIFGRTVECVRSYTVALRFRLRDGELELVEIVENFPDCKSKPCTDTDYFEQFCRRDGFDSIAEFSSWHGSSDKLTVLKHLIGWRS